MQLLRNYDYRTRILGRKSARRWNAQPRHERVGRMLDVCNAGAQQAPSLPAALEESRGECLLQARIGFGERGRGLFFAPFDAPPSKDCGFQGIFTTETFNQPQEPAVLLSVRLSCGLTLVTNGGPVNLQQELLHEWQVYQGLALPSRLAALLEATERPPALRLAAWLLWASQVAPSGVAGVRADESRSGDRNGASEKEGECGPNGIGEAPSARLGDNATSIGDDAPYLTPPLQQPSLQPPSQSLVPVPPSRPYLLSEYAQHIMPPPNTAASLLRLADDQERRLPEDARAALRGVRMQVKTYISELRHAGLDWGLSEATLWWAFDMVSSRSFAATAALPLPHGTIESISAISSPRSNRTGNPSFADASDAPSTPVMLALCVPWACLLNHDPSPNATFKADLGQRTFQVMQRSSGFSFLAPKPLVPGEELCISYGEDLDNVQLAVKYGFCTKGNANDRLPMPPELVLAARGLRQQMLFSAAEHVADDLTKNPADGAEGSLQQQRSRVFAAMASLLDPIVIQKGSSMSIDGAFQAAGASPLRALLAWSANAHACSIERESISHGDDYTSRLASIFPPSAQLPFGSFCVDALREERKFMATILHKILKMYCNVAALWP
ncbi:hypothetical protein Vretifemale_20992 [Volvox reticuliferus]|uniref:SET domain-containing protein n=2 Tax=Volvox reticuliferus TaxID=1737510 RepID=A0A8J4G0G9_9CHLO|nr:hypothetical protein Vretifemale_20992 [Volvox reticuliferus]